MTKRLAEIDPRLSLIWPQFESRAIRPTDPGPVLELTDAELGDLIDRRARFDPPRFPAPVDPMGYSIALGASPKSPLRDYGANVYAGRWGDCPSENFIDLGIDDDHPVWCDSGLASTVLGILIGTWEAQWACAVGLPRSGSGNTIGRPFLTWRSATIGEIPRMFADTGPPAETRPLLGGELQVWP
ncbi:hypothetical protein [Phenylobacterium sp.]|uniref:hypothetical protein n=1 Tax=Phenylobacterium sp. TaxID=1871053 RepID=UPI003D2A3D8E